MKKWVLFGASFIIFVFTASFFLWYGGIFTKISLPAESPLPPPPNEGVENNKTLPPLPVGYQELQENNPNMRPDRREAYLNKFNETVAAIKEHPDSIIAWYELGSVKDAFDDHKGTEEAWLFTLQLAPNYTAVLNNLAQLYWRDLPNYPKAEAMFLTIIKIDVTDTTAYRDLSDLYRYNYKEKADQADKILLQGLKDNPKSSDLLSYLAAYYKETGKLDLAIKYYEELLPVAPANTKAAVEQELKDLKTKHSPNQ